MDNIIKLICKNYRFGGVKDFKKIKRGITNDSYSFKDANNQKYFVKEYLNCSKNKILLSYKIKDMIAKEDPKYPLSDQKIAELLKKDNVDIARRTVAKYREILRILPSSQRKKVF